MAHKLISMALCLYLCNATLLDAMGAGAQAQKQLGMDTGDEECAVPRGRSRERRPSTDERSDSPTGKGTKRKTSRSPSPDERKNARKKARREEAEKVPLIGAAKAGDESQVRKLIEAGADVNVSKNDWTPLLEAARSGNEAVVAGLIEAGADVNVQDEEGYTPLMLVFGGIGEVLDRLMDRDRTAFTLPRLVEKITPVVDHLLNASADVNIQLLRERATALMMAAEVEGTDSIIEKLLQAGAKTQLKDRAGKTAYDIALEAHNVAIANLIQEYEAKQKEGEASAQGAGSSSAGSASAGDDDVEMFVLTGQLGSAPFGISSSAGAAAGAGAGAAERAGAGVESKR